jgi:hypothetical protein
MAVMPEVAGALFYERLFDANPSFRTLFKNDMRIQGVRLMTMLAMVVYNFLRPVRFRPRFKTRQRNEGRGRCLTTNPPLALNETSLGAQ